MLSHFHYKCFFKFRVLQQFDLPSSPFFSLSHNLCASFTSHLYISLVFFTVTYMASMNLLGFSLSPQEQHPSSTQDHQTVVPSLFGFNPHDDASGVQQGDHCFDLTSHSSTPHHLSHPFSIYDAFHTNNNIHTTQGSQ